MKKWIYFEKRKSENISAAPGEVSSSRKGPKRFIQEYALCFGKTEKVLRKISF